MTTVKLAGQELPLCLTVAAVERVHERGVDLSEISTLYTTGDGRTVNDCLDNSVWLLDVLMQEGRQNAALHGMDTPMPPPADMLPHLLTPGQVIHEIIPAIVATVGAGLGRTVEADHTKNGANAAGEP